MAVSGGQNGGAASKQIHPSAKSKDRWLHTQECTDGFPRAFLFDGFCNQRFNVPFYRRSQLQLGGQPSYWDKEEQHFLFYQAEQVRWALCPRWDGSEDLLAAVQKGGVRGLAYEEADAGVWQEYKDGRWDVATRVRLRRVNDPDGPRRGTSFVESTCSERNGRGLSSVKEMKRLLSVGNDLEELLLVREDNCSEVRLVFKFSTPKEAGEIVDLGRKLLDCAPKAVDPIGKERVSYFRNYNGSCTFRTPAGQNAKLSQVQQSGAAATHHSTSQPDQLAIPQPRSKAKSAPARPVAMQLEQPESGQTRLPEPLGQQERPGHEAQRQRASREQQQSQSPSDRSSSEELEPQRQEPLRDAGERRARSSSLSRAPRRSPEDQRCAKGARAKTKPAATSAIGSKRRRAHGVAGSFDGSESEERVEKSRRTRDSRSRRESRATRPRRDNEPQIRPRRRSWHRHQRRDPSRRRAPSRSIERRNYGNGYRTHQRERHGRARRD
eukprot:TRINITY_DN94800_c0_g1_i1.p1 TRINITY_DN94800_c0_g1~~TRINITY_DN94800_c0_g1_i1.p1  ORF type:complete len:506 (+),score=86.84 TRINITY_DN94800_c0_g1_i1:39-1520(+)